MTREEAIRILEANKPVIKNASMSARKYVEAFDMAIASLKTDEAYQLEYENRDFVEISKGMTNGEVIQALFPNVKIEDASISTMVGTNLDGSYIPFLKEWWNAPYKAEKGDE